MDVYEGKETTPRKKHLGGVEECVASQTEDCHSSRLTLDVADNLAENPW